MKLVIQGIQTDLFQKPEAVQQGMLLRNLPGEPVSEEVTLTITGSTIWSLSIEVDVLGGGGEAFDRTPNQSKRLLPSVSRRAFPRT